MNERALREGGCIIFAWGPPWNWWPSIQRSRPVGKLYLHAALWEQQEARRTAS